MTTLIVGFDSAWTPTKCGAVLGVLQLADGTFRELGLPQIADFVDAEEAILKWQVELKPTTTIILLDQPTIVRNSAGQRPVENLVGSSVSLRYGGTQPANTAKEKMFGKEAPVWRFLSRLGGPANPLRPTTDTHVFETYPVLAMIALGWTLPDSRTAGRLPKYNPERRKTFSTSDWQHVCSLVSVAFRERGLLELVHWIDCIALKSSPNKSDQDGLDACLCLLVAFYMTERKDCLMIGEQETGYIIVPYGDKLREELETRCCKTGRIPSQWVRIFRMA